MEITGEPPPLWPQLAATMTRRHRRSPFPLFTPPVLIILLPTIALLLLFFAVPPFLSTIATQISKPTGVKKSSDSLTIYLLFFAILCGIFARRNDDNGNGENDNSGNDGINNKLSHPVSPRWFDQYPEKKIYDDHPPMNTAAASKEAVEATTSLRRLRRSSSSYPDLRQASLWGNSEDQFRFPDDFEINKYRSSTSNYHDQVHELRRSWTRQQFEETEPNVIPPSESPAPSTPTPPPQPPTSPPPPSSSVDFYRKPIRTYQVVGQKEKVINQEHYDDNFHRSKPPQPVTPPKPPPPPPRRPPSPLVQTGNETEQRYAKLERRKSNAAKEIKVVFASLRKRKKKKAKDHNHDHHEHDCPLHSPREPPHYYSTNIPPPSPPPPPPPLPPPPSSVFQKYNLFKSKANKSKKIHSVPPPPPPSFSVSNLQNRQMPPTTPLPPEPSRRRTTAKAKSCRPPLPTKANTSYYDENVNSGGQSPLIPNPPPPPPFKTPEFKFMFRGDFVNIRSSPSSRCSSPDIEKVNVSSSIDGEKVSMMDGGDGIGGVPVICPSPDVNAKAETFIARFRDGWKLEKINSMKEKQKQS